MLQFWPHLAHCAQAPTGSRVMNFKCLVKNALQDCEMRNHTISFMWSYFPARGHVWLSVLFCLLMILVITSNWTLWWCCLEMNDVRNVTVSLQKKFYHIEPSYLTGELGYHCSKGLHSHGQIYTMAHGGLTRMIMRERRAEWMGDNLGGWKKFRTAYNRILRELKTLDCTLH